MCYDTKTGVSCSHPNTSHRHFLFNECLGNMVVSQSVTLAGSLTAADELSVVSVEETFVILKTSSCMHVDLWQSNCFWWQESRP